MNFEINQLPFEQFETLGLEKKDVLTMPPRTLNALLSGNRTSLIRFNNIKIGNNQEINLDAKLSLVSDKNNNAVLKIHPVNHTAKNIYNLNNEELGYLQNGETNFITKQLKNKNGKLDDYLISLDQSTKEYIAINKSAIVPPENINGINLTDKQKIDFANGKEIEINKEKYRLDPNNEVGITDNKKNESLTSVQFQHSKYSSTELAIDIALLASGIGSYVMIEHIANLLLYSLAATIKNEISNKDVRNKLANAGKDLSNKQMTAQEVKSIVEHHLGRPVDMDQLHDIDSNEKDVISKGIEEAEENPMSKLLSETEVKEKMDDRSTKIKL